MKKIVLLILTITFFTMPMSVFADEIQIPLLDASTQISSNAFTSIPYDTEENVPLNTNLELTFNESLDSKTVNKDTIIVNNNPELIENIVIKDDKKIVVTFLKLSEGSIYIVNINGVVCNGNPINDTIKFTTKFVESQPIKSYEGETLKTFHLGQSGTNSVEVNSKEIKVQTSKSCYISSTRVNLNTKDIGKIEIGIKSDKDFLGRLYFSKQWYTGFSENKSFDFNVKASGYAKSYIIDTKNNPQWADMIVQLRIAQADNIDNTFSIEYIRFADENYTSGSDVKIGSFELYKDFNTKEVKQITNKQMETGDISAVIGNISNKSEMPFEAVLILAQYNGNELMRLKYKKIEVLPNTTSGKIEISIPIDDSNNNVKVFLRKGIDNVVPIKQMISTVK